MSTVTVKQLIDIYKSSGVDACFDYVKTNCQYGGLDKTLKKSINKLITNYKSLVKSKSRENFADKLNAFLMQIYELPTSAPFANRISGVEKQLENITDIEVARKVVKDLTDTVNTCRLEHEQILQENERLKNVLKKRDQRCRNYKKLSQNKFILEKRVKALLKLVARKNCHLKQVRSSKSYQQHKIVKLSEQIDVLESEITTLQNTVCEKDQSLHLANQTVSLAQAENQYLELFVQDKTVNLYDEDCKAYSTSTQECIYGLLSSNVTTSKVSPVIESVLKMVNLHANRLPSVTTVNNMNVQRLILAQKQLSEVLPKEQNLCLLSDETSKFGKKIEGFHVASEGGQLYVLGLRQMVTKSAQDTLSTFQNILSDITEVSQSSDNDNNKRILMNIVSTMSDRAATQQKFNTILEEYRTVVIQEELGQAWTDMSAHEQLVVSKLNNFFCGLHALVHIADAANACVQVVENAFFADEPPIHDKCFKNMKESGATRLIRTASKAFSCGGDEKSGVYGSFSSYVREFLLGKKMRSVPLERFRGNRFNILFSNAANVFFLHSHIIEFLSVEDSNRLLKAVKHDVNIPLYVAGLKALGLIAHLITTPLWCFIEDKTIHILDSAVYYNEMLTFLDASVQNIVEFIEGKCLLSFADEQQLYSNEVFKALIEPWEHDDKVMLILSTVLPGIRECMSKLFGDYLDDGQWAIAPPSKREKTMAVPKNNKFSETIFGHVDRILREKPNIATISQEAYIMFCHNKTLKWLQEKSESDRAQLCIDARKHVNVTRALFQRRRNEIEEKRMELLKEKMQSKELKEQKQLEWLESCTNNIIEWGLWQSEAQVDDHVGTLPFKKDKISALKAQLHFRKDILKQRLKSDDKVYAMTKLVDGKRTALTAEELSVNVKKLVQHALSLPGPNDDDNAPMLVGRDIDMKFVTDERDQWSRGFVISRVPGYSSWYNVKFRNDRSVYSYELMEDYRRGDVRILV